jgi:hypothetical protein
MFMWAVSPYAIANATNGLETSLAVCLILAVASYFPRLERAESGPREFFVFGVLGGFALFSRADAGLLLAVAALLSIRNVFARGTAAALNRGAATAAGVFLVNIPWWMFTYHYTGRVYPDSGRAIRQVAQFGAQHPTKMYLPEFAEAVGAILDGERPTFVLLLVAVLIIVLRGRVAAFRSWVSALWEKQRLLIVFAGALLCAYAMYIFGEWFFFRYFYVISVVVLLATALTIDHALALFRSTRRRAVPYMLAALFLAAAIARREPQGQNSLTGEPRTFGDIYFRADAIHRAWMNIGLWAKDHFPAGTVIGCPTSGALGYFADNLTVVNLDGVVNHDAYQAATEHRLLDYARSAKVQHLLVWGGTMSFIRSATASLRQEDLVFERDLDFESLGRPWHVYRLLAR